MNEQAPSKRTESNCAHCDRPVYLADDGAWEDESGACGCSDSPVFEHEPSESADWTDEREARPWGGGADW
jgi:hypothetical protein